MAVLLQQYYEMEKEKRRLEEHLERLRQDDRFQQELQFSEKLEALLTEYGKTSKEVIKLLDPTAYDTAPNKQTRKRSLRIYRNPHTGEKVETYGGNHKVIRQWKEEYGEAEVLKWVEIVP